MNKTVAIANAKHAPNTAPSDDVSTNTIAMENKLAINPQSLAPRAAALVPIPPPKSPDAPKASPRQHPPASTPNARAHATAKSQKARQRSRSPDKCSAASMPRGSNRSSEAPRKPSAQIPALTSG